MIHGSKTTRAATWTLLAVLRLLALPLLAADTFTPYRTADEIPRNVVELRRDYDARKEALDAHVFMEWKAAGVVTRYVTFKVSASGLQKETPRLTNSGSQGTRFDQRE